MLVSELFLTESQTLLEKLGNLSQLKAGKLLPALMQQYERYAPQKKIKGDKRDTEKRVADYGWSAKSHYRDKLDRHVGTKSEITDIGAVKNFAALKKHQPNNAGFALYLDGKAVFVIIPSDSFSRPTAVMKAAWDPRAFGKVQQDPIIEKGFRSRSYERKLPDAKEEEDVVVGSLSTAKMKKMIDDLIEANPGKVTAKIIGIDQERVQGSYRGRPMQHVERFESLTGLEALTKRLQKYKLSKNPTAKDIEEFFQMALSGKNSKIQLDGKSYQIEQGYDSDKTNLNRHNAAIFKGKPFKVVYNQIMAKGEYGADSITITMKFFPETMTLAPVSIENNRSDDKKKKVYHAEAHAMDKLGISAAKLTPAVLEKHFNSLSSPQGVLNQVSMIDDIGLSSEYDEVIKQAKNKANRALAKERIGALHDGSVKTRLDKD